MTIKKLRLPSREMRPSFDADKEARRKGRDILHPV